MTKVHFVKSARKDNRIVKKGEPYYWWKHPYKPMEYSKTKPTEIQTTSSPFRRELLQLQAYIQHLTDPDDLDDIIDGIRSLADECEQNLANMPEYLQDTSEPGQLLLDRFDALNEWADELEAVDREIVEGASDEELPEIKQRIMDDIWLIKYEGE